jgi:VanZ family protein
MLGERRTEGIGLQGKQVSARSLSHALFLNRLGDRLNLAADLKPLKVRRFAANEQSKDKRLANLMRAWGPAAAWATVLFLLSAWPNPSLPSWVVAYDKLAHGGLYGVLGVALGWGRHHDSSRPPHLTLLAVGGIYGATDEWHQAFVYGRTPGWGDWTADIVGVSVGYFLALFILSRIAPVAMPTGRNTDVAD